MRSGVGLLAAALGAACVEPPPDAPAPPQEVARVERRVTTMGTELLLVAYGPPAATNEAFDAVVARFRALDDDLTTWRVSGLPYQLNHLPPGTPVRMSPEFLDNLLLGLRYGARTGGRFDVTFATLSPLWRFDEDRDGRVPEDAAIDALLPAVGPAHLQIDAVAGTVRRDDPRTQVSFGGLAKGYAVARGADVLRAAGVRPFLVQAGGDLYAEGTKPDGTPFFAAVADPAAPDGPPIGRMPLDGAAFSTAGDYARAFTHAGRRYHHLLDARTGRPSTSPCRSVTIWHPDPFEADALDDAVFLLGPEEGLALVEATPGAGAVLVLANGAVRVSSRLEGRFRR